MILVTGCAGFIGSHVVKALLEAGNDVVGIDNLNNYYDPALKHLRLAPLLANKTFKFIETNIARDDFNTAIIPYQNEITHIVHLAAQAGVRASITQPMTYGYSNLIGHLQILELARHAPKLEHLLYASSSSVYGNRKGDALSITDRTDEPVSLYAATKKAGELMSEAYAHLYPMPATGLRFFTVYGPYGRPDMAYFSFSEAITRGKPITVFGEGLLRRDFTYIDDIVDGILALMPLSPQKHRVLNLGHNKPHSVNKLVQLLENNLGVKAIIEHKPRDPSDVEETFADIDATRDLCGFDPKVTLEDGIERFCTWFKAYRSLS